VAGLSESGDPVRLGLVGYGTGGQHFHAPFIDAADGIELVGVVTRSAERRALVAEDWPGVPTYESLTEILAAGVDAVTITTPPATRRDLVLEAIAAGVHVVADKPFAPTAAVGSEMAVAAESAGVLLSVFHNRRWDSDVRTLRVSWSPGSWATCGGCTPVSTSTILRRWRPARPAASCAISAVTSLIRWSGCSARCGR
jgi:hypothetical protein